jgi:hypothetical protein
MNIAYLLGLSSALIANLSFVSHPTEQYIQMSLLVTLLLIYTHTLFCENVKYKKTVTSKLTNQLSLYIGERYKRQYTISGFHSIG